MSWVLLPLAAWLVVSLPLAVVVGRVIHRADRRDPAAEPAPERIPALHLVRDDPVPVDASGQAPLIPTARFPRSARRHTGDPQALPPGAGRR